MELLHRTHTQYLSSVFQCVWPGVRETLEHHHTLVDSNAREPATGIITSSLHHHTLSLHHHYMVNHPHILALCCIFSEWLLPEVWGLPATQSRETGVSAIEHQLTSTCSAFFTTLGMAGQCRGFYQKRRWDGRVQSHVYNTP